MAYWHTIMNHSADSHCALKASSTPFLENKNQDDLEQELMRVHYSLPKQFQEQDGP